MSNRSSWLLGCLLAWLVSPVALAQDLFDCDHTARYARYLFDTQEYEKAAGEYERLLINCDSVAIIPRLFAAYRLSGQYDRLTKRITQLFPPSVQPTAFAARERLKLSLLTGRYAQADSLLIVTGSRVGDETYYRLKYQVLTSQWLQASQQLTRLDTNQVPNYRDWATLIRQGQQYQPKSPLLAASLSTLVPGLGKVYTHDWKDAVVTLLFVGGLGYQAYRTFNRHPDSAVGWAYATVGAGFYLGNIYGSYKSAHQYNQRRLTRLHNEAKRLSFLDF